MPMGKSIIGLLRKKGKPTYLADRPVPNDLSLLQGQMPKVRERPRGESKVPLLPVLQDLQ